MESAYTEKERQVYYGKRHVALLLQGWNQINIMLQFDLGDGLQI